MFIDIISSEGVSVTYECEKYSRYPHKNGTHFLFSRFYKSEPLKVLVGFDRDIYERNSDGKTTHTLQKIENK